MHRGLEEFLAAKQARYRRLSHAGAVTAQEQAAATDTSGSFAKAVIVKERDGLVAAVLPACCVLDLNRLKGLIGHGEIRLANAEEIWGSIPDISPGAIPPFGPLFRLPTYVDRALLDGGEITMSAGDFATAIRMGAAEFRRLADGRVGDFGVPESQAPPRIARARSSGRRAGHAKARRRPRGGRPR